MKEKRINKKLTLEVSVKGNRTGGGKDVLIESERLILRKLIAQDTEAFFRYRSLEKVMEFQSFHPRTLKDAEDFIANTADEFRLPDTWYQLAIVRKGEDQLLGDLGIHFIDDAQAEFGITLDPRFQKRGYAEEAAAAVLGFLFGKLEMHRVIASADPRNAASVHLLEKLGMRKEAHFVKSYQLENGWADDVVYALLEEEWIGQYIFAKNE